VTSARNFQIVGAPGLKRTDHVWFRRKGRWKCALCGCFTRKAPPKFPTPEGWLPEGVEKLTPDERALCPPEEGVDGT
jgi:hypothetical protein